LHLLITPTILAALAVHTEKVTNIISCKKQQAIQSFKRLFVLKLKVVNLVMWELHWKHDVKV